MKPVPNFQPKPKLFNCEIYKIGGRVSKLSSVNVSIWQLLSVSSWPKFSFAVL